MPHINTEPGQHDLTVSAYIVRTDFERPKLLLHKHKKLNVLLQFGGHKEPDEGPWESMLREIVEETGYQPSQLQLLQPEDRVRALQNTLLPIPFSFNTHPIATPDLEGKAHFHDDLAYAFVTDQEPAGKPAKGESVEWTLVDRDELGRLGPPEVWPDLVTLGQFVLDVCVPKWERVPASS